MASRNLTLPLDVISEVISHVSCNKDILTLRALSTTCSALLEPSQRKLFNGLTIQVFPHNNRRRAYLSLNHIFHVSPHLTTYVQDLTISFETEYPDNYIVPVLKQLCSIQSLKIKYTHWIMYPEQILQWHEVVDAVLRPSLRRLDLGGYGVLPSTVCSFPTLVSIDLGKWRIEDMKLDDALPDIKRRLAISWAQADPCKTLKSFLRISPRLSHLKVSQISIPSTHPQFKGSSKVLTDSPLTVSTLKTLTLLFSWDKDIPLAGILLELEELSLFDGSALQKIRIDLDCHNYLTDSKLLERLDGIDNNIHWAGFSRLWLLEVNVNKYFIDMEEIIGESQRAVKIEYLERGVREKIKRIKDRANVEVLITVNLKSERPGGWVFDHITSWEELIAQATPTLPEPST